MSLRRARPWLAILAGLSAGLAIWLSPAGEGPISVEEASSTQLEGGLQLVQAELMRGSRRAGHLAVYYAPVDRVRARLTLNPQRLTVAELAPPGGLAMNAGYFTPERKATGLLVSEGLRLSPFIPQAGAAGSGVLLIEGGAVQLLERDQIKDRSFEEAALAIQAGPRIIEPGGRPGIRSDNGRRANRSFIGRDPQGRLVLGVCYHPDPARGRGLSLFELQDVLTRGLASLSEELALDAALNLDGGPSTGLSSELQRPPLSYPEAAAVHSVLTLNRRPRLRPLPGAQDDARPATCPPSSSRRLKTPKTSRPAICPATRSRSAKSTSKRRKRSSRSSGSSCRSILGIRSAW